MSKSKIVLGLVAALMLSAFLIVGCGQTPASPTPTAASALTIKTTSLPDGNVGISYSQMVQVSGGAGNYVWSITGGSLPAGLHLDPNGGVISGTAFTGGTSNFTVQVKDGAGATVTQSLSLTFKSAPGPLTVMTVSLFDGEVAVAYSQTILVNGGSGKYIEALVSGSLPDGLTLDGNTGVISGTPKTAGKFQFGIQVRDSAGGMATQSLSMKVFTAPAIATTSLPNGEDAIIYAQGLQASGGTENFTWSLSGGSLPDGLTLTSGSGEIFGTATKPGTFTFSVRVNDGMGTASQSLSINILTALTLKTTSLPSGSVGAVYSQTLQASAGGVPYTWSLTSGALPDGLTLDAATGVISGTPRVAGNYTFTARVLDFQYAVSEAKLSITVNVSP